MSAWYFAYGSNLSIEQMSRRAGLAHAGASVPKIARLENSRVVFNMHGSDGNVYANLLTPGEGVLGVIYSCGEAHLKKLDAFEEGYERRVVRVRLENGDEREAFTYFAESASMGQCSRPTAIYLAKILDGARQHGLPDAYIQKLEATAKNEERVS